MDNQAIPETVLDEALQAQAEHQAAAQVTLPPNAQDNALLVINSNLEKFCKLAATRSKRQLLQVIQALAYQPLNAMPFQFSYPEDRELFEIGVELNNAKLILLYLGLRENEEKHKMKEKESNG